MGRVNRPFCHFLPNFFRNKKSYLSDQSTVTGLPKGHVPSCILLKWIDWLFNSLASHGNYPATSSVTIKKTGKQVDLGLFRIIYVLRIRLYAWKFLENFLKLALLVLWGSFLGKKATHSYWYCQQRKNSEKIWVFFPYHVFTSHSLVQLLFPTVKLDEVRQPVSIEYKMVQVRNKQCLHLPRSERSSASGHENPACQWLFFDWLISGHQSVNRTRKVIFFLIYSVWEIQQIYEAWHVFLQLVSYY